MWHDGVVDAPVRRPLREQGVQGVHALPQLIVRLRHRVNVLWPHRHARQLELQGPPRREEGPRRGEDLIGELRATREGSEQGDVKGDAALDAPGCVAPTYRVEGLGVVE